MLQLFLFYLHRENKLDYYFEDEHINFPVTQIFLNEFALSEIRLLI